MTSELSECVYKSWRDFMDAKLGMDRGTCIAVVARGYGLSKRSAAARVAAVQQRNRATFYNGYEVLQGEPI